MTPSLSFLPLSLFSFCPSRTPVQLADTHPRARAPLPVRDRSSTDPSSRHTSSSSRFRTSRNGGRPSTCSTLPSSCRRVRPAPSLERLCCVRLGLTGLVELGPGPTDEQPPLSVDAAAAAAAAAAEVGGAAKDDDSEDDDQPIFSTTTGTYRHPKRYGATTTTTKSATRASPAPPRYHLLLRSSTDAPSSHRPADSTSLTLRSSDSALTHTNLPAPSELWKGRTWVGLDPRVGLDKVGVLEEGRGGRAWNYEEEKERGE
jgi:hypothetical protein